MENHVPYDAKKIFVINTSMNISNNIKKGKTCNSAKYLFEIGLNG